MEFFFFCEVCTWLLATVWSTVCILVADCCCPSKVCHHGYLIQQSADSTFQSLDYSPSEMSKSGLATRPYLGQTITLKVNEEVPKVRAP